ncbi:unnamed protein product [Soboliphyme baturini]|uniref:Glycosyl transferase n=1 Tax=Soboliphyme baturini TaxID=241478 RepID=A0A183IIW7_9BILA|nr:unnamed protein product [Soboliphyme baturini]
MIEQVTDWLQLAPVQTYFFGLDDIRRADVQIVMRIGTLPWTHDVCLLRENSKSYLRPAMANATYFRFYNYYCLNNVGRVMSPREAIIIATSTMRAYAKVATNNASVFATGGTLPWTVRSVRSLRSGDQRSHRRRRWSSSIHKAKQHGWSMLNGG